MAKKRPTSDAESVSRRVYYLPEELRAAINRQRAAWGMTVGEFTVDAVTSELPRINRVLKEHLPNPAGKTRPMRVPMPYHLLEILKEASAKSGLPATKLLLACLSLASGRKRRRSSDPVTARRDGHTE